METKEPVTIHITHSQARRLTQLIALARDPLMEITQEMGEDVQVAMLEYEELRECFGQVYKLLQMREQLAEFTQAVAGIGHRWAD